MSTSTPSPPIDGQDEAQDQFPEPPIWAAAGTTTATTTTTAGTQDSTATPAPPPTYDPTKLASTPAAPKPRKNNRISVLAYPTTTTPPPPGAGTVSPPLATSSPGLPLPSQGSRIGGGPLGLHGSRVGSGLPLQPSPSPTPSANKPPLAPPPRASGTTAAAPVNLADLPPSASTTPAPPTAPKGDFRNAEILHHWNDPPTKIFEKKSGADEAAAFDFGPMKHKLSTLVETCSSKVSAAQKRMFEDTQKRLQALLEQMDKGTVKDRVRLPLGEMIDALWQGNYAGALTIHGKLMQTDFDSEGRWLLGFKRLTDLAQSLAIKGKEEDSS
ncbi:hypothetical protein DFQ27_004621 [Actinomortierella ambigua]|uniref:SRA1/Sec31 domain-containing protein n=1 Tax=Actinomortierella ambigua TaxID=1343610 RepID=A0A9P6Q2M8_9FUNG|nr:hypothetical protein DFQ27_004621 [Actinomortierella ambigua]